MSETFYERLGVSRDASEDDIERAYRDLVTDVHPDVTDDPDASEQFERLTRARDVLTDPTERQRYDRLGHGSYIAAEDGTRPDSHDGTGQTGAGGGSEPQGPTTGGSDSTPGGQGGRTQAASSGQSQATSARASSARTTTGARGNTRTRSKRGGRRDDTSENEADSARVETARLRWSARFLELFGYTFVCYPVMVLSAVFPPFPLLVNVVVGVCSLGLVVYLMAVPHVGMAVFGAWSLLATAGLLLGSQAGMVGQITVPGGAGIGPFDALLILVGLTTWLPFIISSLVYRGYSALYHTG